MPRASISMCPLTTSTAAAGASFCMAQAIDGTPWPTSRREIGCRLNSARPRSRPTSRTSRACDVARDSGRALSPTDSGLFLSIQGAVSGDRGGGAGFVRLSIQASGNGRRRSMRGLHGSAAPRRCGGRPVQGVHARPDQPLAAGPGPGVFQEPRAGCRRAAHCRRPAARSARPFDLSGRCRPRLPQPGPWHADAFRRREPANPSGQPDRQRTDRRSLRAR